GKGRLAVVTVGARGEAFAGQTAGKGDQFALPGGRLKMHQGLTALATFAPIGHLPRPGCKPGGRNLPSSAACRLRAGLAVPRPAAYGDSCLCASHREAAAVAPEQPFRAAQDRARRGSRRDSQSRTTCSDTRTREHRRKTPRGSPLVPILDSGSEAPCRRLRP